MTVDFQVVVPQEVITLSNIELQRVDGIYVLRITGADFSAVDEVLINSAPSPDVVVVNTHVLLAQLPDSMQDSPEVTTCQVLSRTFTLSPRSLLRFRIGRTPGRVTGAMRLMQLFVRMLLKTPGKDSFNPTSGGGLLRAINKNINSGDGQDLVTDLVIAVNQVQRQLIALQAKDQRSPRSERLLSAKLSAKGFDRDSGTLYATIELLNQEGSASTLNMEL